MALYDSIASALGDYKPSAGEEISLKIKPAQQLVAGQASNGQLSGSPSNIAGGSSAGIGGGVSYGPVTPGGGRSSQQVESGFQAPGRQGVPSPPGSPPRFWAMDGGTGFGPGGTTATTPEQRLGRNLQLVQPPMGAYTDAEFEARLAAARNEMETNYLDILQQLGWVGDNGEFVPGQVEIEGARQRAQLQHDMELARMSVTGDARRTGTVFSGRRVKRQADAEHPFTQALAKLEGDIPLALGNLFQQAAGLKSAFENQLNLLLAEAAARRAQDLRENPPQDDTPPPPAGPPAPPTPPVAPPAEPFFDFGRPAENPLAGVWGMI